MVLTEVVGHKLVHVPEVYDGSSWSEVNDLTRGTTDQGSQYVTLSGDFICSFIFGGNTDLQKNGMEQIGQKPLRQVSISRTKLGVVENLVKLLFG